MSTADDYYIYGRSEERLSANVLCSYAQTRPLLTVHRCGLRQWRARAGRLPQTAPEARGPRACALLLRRRALSFEMSPAQKMFAAKKVDVRALVWVQGDIRDSGSGSLLAHAILCHHNNTPCNTAFHLFRRRKLRQKSRDHLSTTACYPSTVCFMKCPYHVRP